jgi:7-cyano-7-deazaguanine synthase
LKAIILLSGGVDSTVMLALAHQQKKQCVALSFDYGQKHRIELESAKHIALHYQISHQIITFSPAPFGHSALTDPFSTVLKDRTPAEIASAGIPNTYVPARNTIFLAYALGFAEICRADEIHFGANAMDTAPYPDCRPEFFQAFQSLINLATKQSIEGRPPRLLTPLQHMDKTKIVAEGLRLKAPLHKTFSCYAPQENGSSCHHCDACILREAAFIQNNMHAM